MLPPDVTDLLGRQYRLIAHHQFRPLVPDPVERGELRRRLGLEPVTTRVLGHPVHEPGPGRRLLTAVLDAGPGAVLWGKTAATWWGFGRFRLAPIHVGRSRCSSRPPHGAQLHNIRHLDPLDVTEHQGVPIIRPERVVSWLAAMWTHRWKGRPGIATDKVGTTLDHAWREGLIDGRYLHELAERSGGRGRSGIVALRAALESRPPDYLPAGSGAEERFESILSRPALRQLRRQVSVSDHSPIGVVDHEAVPWPLVVEINGEQWHTTWTDRQEDDKRYERLMAKGYSILVLWQYDLWHDIAVVQEVVTRLLANPDPVPTLHRPTPAPWQL